MSEQSWRDALDAGLSQLAADGLTPPDEHQREQLIRFLSLLVKWNRVYNLTAVREPRQMIDRHLLDSLVLASWLPVSPAGDAQVYDVIDIGTGAGLPVLPLAMVRPDLRFLSVESVGKKTRFQQQAVMALNLSNVTVCNRRIQDTDACARLVMSRAFTAPAAFLEIARDHCLPDAQVLILLGRAERLPEVLPSGFTLLQLQAVRIPGTDTPRHIALCQRQPG